MKHLVAISSLLAAAITLAVVRAQTTPPTDAERLSQTAKDFGMTTEQLEKFIRHEMGDPIIVDGNLVVGVHRDDAGHVKSVKISTPKRNLEFNRVVADGRPGLSYMGGEIAPGSLLASATDLDGDARVDQLIMVNVSGDTRTSTILLRVGDRYEPATALGEKRFNLQANGRTVTFDLNQREWVEQ